MYKTKNIMNTNFPEIVIAVSKIPEIYVMFMLYVYTRIAH